MIVVGATLLGVLAWQLDQRGYRQWAIFCLMVLGLLLRLFVSSDGFLHERDERYHALVAKHLLDHPLLFTLYENPVLPYDYRDWSQ